MEIHHTKLFNYEITYLNSREYRILKREIFSEEIYECEIDKKSPLIIDIGAHIGLATLYFKRQYPESRVIAIEPNPYLFPLLQENIVQNGLTNVSTYNFAVTGKGKECELYIDESVDNWYSNGSLLPKGWDGKQKNTSVKVPAKRLCEVIDERVDILKIDIEGLEQEIVNISAECLKMVDNVLIEFHKTKKQSLEKMVAVLERVGFDMKVEAEVKAKAGSGLVIIKGQRRS